MIPKHRTRRIVIGRNPVDNSVENLSINDEIHGRGDQDSLDNIYCEEKSNLQCGCFGAPGGRCSECGAISCTRCHRHCGGTDQTSPLGCNKPICRQHSYFLIVDNGVNLPFCKQCYSKIIRDRRFKKIGRLLLSPFIDME